MKSFRLVTPSDELYAEIIITLRAGFGMKPAEYNPQSGYLEIPDDHKAKKVKKDKGAEKKAKAEAMAVAKAAKDAADKEPKD